MNTNKLTVLALTTLALTGCGGSDSSSSNTPTPAPEPKEPQPEWVIQYEDTRTDEWTGVETYTIEYDCKDKTTGEYCFIAVDGFDISNKQLTTTTDNGTVVKYSEWYYDILIEDTGYGDGSRYMTYRNHFGNTFEHERNQLNSHVTLKDADGNGALEVRTEVKDNNGYYTVFIQFTDRRSEYLSAYDWCYGDVGNPVVCNESGRMVSGEFLQELLTHEDVMSRDNASRIYNELMKN